MAQLLGADGGQSRANLDSPLPKAPGQAFGVRRTVAAQKTGDRFAAFDHKAELAVLVPAIGLVAELQRPLDVGMADFRAQPMGIVSVAQVLMTISDAVDVPFLFRQPVHHLLGQRLPRQVIKNFDRYFRGCGEVGDMDVVG